MLLAHIKKSPNGDSRDQDLWSALQDGRREVLSELFQRHHRHLYNYGINIVSNPELVNEAIQDLFLSLWEKRSNLSAARSVKAYLLSSLRRLILKRIRQEKNRAERNRNYIQNRGELSFSVEKSLIRQEIALEKRIQLQEALESLTARQREAVFLKFYHGLSNKELVEVMDINYQCVRNLLYKALERLRSVIETVSNQK